VKIELSERTSLEDQKSTAWRLLLGAVDLPTILEISENGADSRSSTFGQRLSAQTRGRCRRRRRAKVIRMRSDRPTASWC